MARRRRPTRTRPTIIPRKRRKPGTLFARNVTSDVAGELADLGCPDCRGVLAAREEGRQGHLSFVCSIGHAYSGESLMTSKEEQLEDTLWSAIEVYQEIAHLYLEMSARVRADGVRGIADAYQRRARRAGEYAASLRQIIGKDGPAESLT